MPEAARITGGKKSNEPGQESPCALAIYSGIFAFDIIGAAFADVAKAIKLMDFDYFVTKVTFF